MEEGLLVNQLKGTVPLIVKHNNDLHALLKQVAVAFRDLSVQPDPTVHEITRQSMAIGMTTLDDCKKAKVIGEAAEILAVKDTSKAASAAKALIGAHAAAFDNKPELLWAELRQCAAYVDAFSKGAKRPAQKNEGEKAMKGTCSTRTPDKSCAMSHASSSASLVVPTPDKIVAVKRLGPETQSKQSAFKRFRQ